MKCETCGGDGMVTDGDIERLCDKYGNAPGLVLGPCPECAPNPRGHIVSHKGGRTPEHFNCSEFASLCSYPGPAPEPHDSYSKEMAMAGCPRCMDTWLNRLRQGTEVPPTSDEMNEMNLAVNHTMDGYWQGMRAPILSGLVKHIKEG